MVGNFHATGWLLAMSFALGLVHTPNARAEETTRTASSPANARISGLTEMLLVKAQPVELVLHAPSEFSPILFVNVGTLSEAKRTGPKQWTFTYNAPEERYPQVALIAARSASGEQIAVHRIDLLGTPKIRVQSEPYVSVHVHVRDQVFGPVKTDGKGRGRIEVNVPPGLRVAKTLGTDSYGNTTTRRLPLDVPPFNRHLLVCSDNGENIFLLSASNEGKPSDKPDVKLVASHGTTPRLKSIQPGLFRARWNIVPEAHDDDTVTLTALSLTGGTTAAVCMGSTPVPETSVVLTPPSPVEPIAEPKYRLGLRTGGATNGARISGPWLSARFAQTRFSTLPNLVIAVEAGLYMSSDNSQTVDGIDVEIRFVGTPVFVRTGYERAWDNFVVQAALGSGAVLSGVTVKTNGVKQKVRDTSILYGGTVFGGYHLGPGHLLLETGYWWSSFDNQNITGNVMGLNTTLGYFFAL